MYKQVQHHIALHISKQQNKHDDESQVLGTVSVQNINVGMVRMPDIMAPGIMAPGIMAPSIMTPGIMAPSIMAPGIVATGTKEPITMPHDIKVPDKTGDIDVLPLQFQLTTSRVENIKLEVPAETRVEVPAETRVEVPAETRVDVPAETRVDVPAETPVDVPAETPVDVPAETPVEVPAETPVEVPAESGVDIGDVFDEMDGGNVDDAMMQSMLSTANGVQSIGDFISYSHECARKMTQEQLQRVMCAFEMMCS